MQSLINKIVRLPNFPLRFWSVQISLIVQQEIFSPLELEISLSSKIHRGNWKHAVPDREIDPFLIERRNIGRYNDEQRTRLTRSHRTRWTSITEASLRRYRRHRTRQMLHGTEITRLISPRGNSTRNPSINVVTCESYYRPRHSTNSATPVVSLSLESTTISPLTVEIFRCRRGSSNLAERSRPPRRV